MHCSDVFRTWSSSRLEDSFYHLVLNDMIYNFDDKCDKLLRDLLMIIDELSANLGHSHHGVVLAFKDVPGLLHGNPTREWPGSLRWSGQRQRSACSG